MKATQFDQTKMTIRRDELSPIKESTKGDQLRITMESVKGNKFN